ncbi:hypothetical protein Kalk_00560 [Ketobacter alkanivorans]|uniref:Hydrophobe/amphiphile efflux-1 family RND transporter n=1 Tax=Ketobacter alkanivorans TaxID=1917421 RepID=A0A2K9LFK6_9GAMM|nr:hypothetical protein Kalk_00560 [Ketobacter alkanivorans]
MRWHSGWTVDKRVCEEVRRQGVKVEKRSNSILQVVTMSSPGEHYDSIFISNYTLINVIDELKRIPGVGSASLFGAKDYAMRVWLRPDMLAAYRLTPSEVAEAIRNQNAQFAAGQFGQEPMPDNLAFTYSVSTRSRMVQPSEFEDIILRSNAEGGVLRLKDVARVELGAQDYAFTATANGEPAVPIGIYLQPGANALATAAAVRDKMEELAQRFPEGLNYDVPFDTTKFVEVSINEVIKTFVEATMLVVLVVFLFLQNIRATIIPVLAIPVSIIGTFAGMYLLGFSINLLTLFGLVLAIGIVVDDAIIVIENVERHMSEEGLPPREAAIQAMEEVSGPVIAIVFVLSSVFIPVAFLGGLTGEMYKQFAVTIAVSVILSGIVALTLTPALCALLLKPTHGEPTLPFRWFNRAFTVLTAGYVGGVRFILRRIGLGLLVFTGLMAITFDLFERVPSSLVPPEDQGYVVMVYQLPPATALNRTEQVTRQMSEKLRDEPTVHSTVTFAGFDILSRSQKSNSGMSFVPLKDWSERTEPAEDARLLVSRFMMLGGDIREAMVFAFNPPPITGISTTGGFEGYLQSRSGESLDVLFSSLLKIA